MDNPKKTLSLALLVVATFFAALGLQKTGLVEFAERSILDNQFRYFQRDDPNSSIVMVSIDEKSLAQFAGNGMYWPWPREFYQLAVDHLSQQGAKAIVFDILFDTPDFDRLNVNGSASDNRFADALKRSQHAVLALKTSQTSLNDVNFKSPDSTLFDISITGNRPQMKSHHFLSIPLPKFSAAAAMAGNTNLQVDPDGVVRNISLIEQSVDKNPIPTLSLATYLMLQPDTTSLQWKPNGLRVGDVTIPINKEGNYKINWYGKGGVKDGTFPYYSFGSVMQSALIKLRNDGGQPPIADSVFKDKIVIIGASASGLSDIKATPFSSLEAYPGMEIHATVLNNLLDTVFITQPGSATTYGIALFLILIIVVVINAYRPALGTLYSMSIILLMAAVGAFLFANYRIVLPSALFLSTGFLAFTGSLGFKYVTEEREKKKIKDAFNHYIQPELVEEIIKKRDSLSLGGEKKELSIMFSDLEGFTSLSETIKPEKLLRILNRYLGSMTDVVFDHKGTIDKFIGDAVIAFWGAPLDLKDHPIYACRCALQMVKKLEELNTLLQKEELPTLKARFGINTGNMIVGNVGSKSRFNYTVIGDSVNLAARLEPMNRLFGTTILISEETYKLLRDEFVCRKVGTFVVKGRFQSVLVFELLGERSDDDLQYKQAYLKSYREALNLFEHKKWTGALDQFEQLLEAKPSDSLIKTYVGYCKKHIENPPGEEWSEIFTLTEK